MTIMDELSKRSGGQCELCVNSEDLQAYRVEPEDRAAFILCCSECREALTDVSAHPNYWRCLAETIWSPVSAVKVQAWRILHQLRDEGWPVEWLDMMYMEEDERSWAQSGHSVEGQVVHKDCNGQVLETGDTVVLIKDLKVKGANFTAKRGTAVRRISLVQDNPDHIEGRVNDQQIVILTQYVKKSK